MCRDGGGVQGLRKDALIILNAEVARAQQAGVWMPQECQGSPWLSFMSRTTAEGQPVPICLTVLKFAKLHPVPFSPALSHLQHLQQVGWLMVASHLNYTKTKGTPVTPQ